MLKSYLIISQILKIKSEYRNKIYSYTLFVIMMNLIWGKSCSLNFNNIKSIINLIREKNDCDQDYSSYET